MWKNILRLFLSAEELHVVDDQHVHHLIEVAEVVHRVVPHCVNELMRESLRADVEDGFVWLAVFDFQPNGMCRWVFPSQPSVNQKGVEGGSTRLVGHGKSSASGKPVALSFNEVVECIVGVQVGVNVQLTQTRNHEGILDRRRFADDGHGHFRIARCADFGGGHADGVWAAGGSTMDVLHDDAVFQASVRTQFFSYRFAQQDT